MSVGPKGAIVVRVDPDDLCSPAPSPVSGLTGVKGKRGIQRNRRIPRARLAWSHALREFQIPRRRVLVLGRQLGERERRPDAPSQLIANRLHDAPAHGIVGTTVRQAS